MAVSTRGLQSSEACSEVRLEPHVPETESAKLWLTQRRRLQYAARCSHIVPSDMATNNDMKWAFRIRHTLQLPG